jgi:Retron-type reverse transcriptase
MTKGVDGTTLDGTSLETFRDLIAEIRDESYTPKPSRRVYIPKANGKLRPLGVPSVKDKIVQEIVRTILECIYDSPKGPTFLEVSHGFRSNRSTHTALKDVVTRWSGTKWWIEGDIKAFFDEIDHEILISLLRKRIEDDRFINLIRKFLKAGYVEDDVFVRTPKGTPQGGLLSPILANVYLHEFDRWVTTLSKSLHKGDKRKANPLWRRYNRQRSYILNKCKGKPNTEEAERISELNDLIAITPSVDINDPDFIRVRYIRYADDWLIGVTGPKRLAEEIKEKATQFFKRYKLELSPEKTKITVATDRADFLGFEIAVPTYKEPLLQKFKASNHSVHTKRRSAARNTVALWVSFEKLCKKLHEERFITYDKNGVPISISKTSYVHLDPDEIVKRYNAIKRGIINYYRPVRNPSVLRRFDYLLRMSLAKTLAHKYRTSMKRQFQLRGRSLRVVKEVKGKKWETSYYECDLSRDELAFSNGSQELDLLFKRFTKTTKSKLGLDCCICGGGPCDMHHLKHLRKGGVTVVKGFDKIMAKINRKQIPVCRPCHMRIHKGEYDGMALKDLHYDPSYV